MRRRNHFLAFGLLLASTVSLPVFAQSAAPGTYPTCNKTPSSTESDLAHQKYIAGKQDYDEGNYESAVRRFRDAYNIDCTKHELLIIISAAYERKGDKKDAVTALETYVARSPTAPDVSTYQAKIDNLKKQIAATPPPTAAPSPTPPAATQETREHTPWPWVVGGAGVVAVGIGFAVLATAPSLPSGCNKDTEKCLRNNNESLADFQDRQERAGRAFRQPTYGIITIVGGGALIAGGLVWHFLEPTGPKESAKTKLRPQLSPGYAGLSLGGTF